MIKNNILFCVFFLIFQFFCFSEDLYNDFLKIYNSYSNENNVYFLIQELQQYNSKNELEKQNYAKSINFGNSQITQISQKNGNLYFLSTNNGYWIKNKKLKQPMKISGSYKVMDIQMQDLLRLDFENDFEIDKTNDDIQFVLLKKTNKKNSYSFLKLKKQENIFVLEVLDNNKQKIKSIHYESSILNGIELFSKITIYDDFLLEKTYYEYITTNLKTINQKLSKNLFNPNFMEELIEILDNQ